MSTFMIMHLESEWRDVNLPSPPAPQVAHFPMRTAPSRPSYATPSRSDTKVYLICWICQVMAQKFQASSGQLAIAVAAR
jgi:hypothetical protein